MALNWQKLRAMFFSVCLFLGFFGSKCCPGSRMGHLFLEKSKPCTELLSQEAAQAAELLKSPLAASAFCYPLSSPVSWISED